MNYSFHCDYCGHTVFGTKAEVTKARKEHRPRVTLGIGVSSRPCPLVQLKDYTLMRPSLITYLRSDEGRHNTLEVV